MNVRTDIRAVSTILIIILMLISAIVGGIISYAFTIAYYARKPEGTAIIITNIYINKENTNNFNISVLNPSYSPTNATISRIAISLEREAQLYDVVETEPPLENGIVVPIGESKNITCIKIRADNANVTLGELIGRFGFAGKNIIVHVFSPDSAAANIRTKLPFVQLEINSSFDPKVSIKKFNITLTNDPRSEVNVTITVIDIPGEVKPNVDEQPITIPRGESRDFSVNINWSGISYIFPLKVKTEQGYTFRKELELKGFSVFIKSVDFSNEDTNHFNVTLFNSDASATYANVTKIRCKLNEETYFDQEFNFTGIMPNTMRTFMLNWNWKEYRNRTITVVAYFLQDFETNPFKAITPPPIIIEILNQASAFDLKNKEHFNITIQNHVSSLEAVNVTKIVVKETGQILNGTNVNPSLPSEPIAPGNYTTFSCNFNWTKFVNMHGRNLTVRVVANTSQNGYTFDFAFVLPVAELNITVKNHFTIGETGYLNLTVKNLEHSLWNLTLSKIVIKIQDLEEPLELEYVLPKNQTIVNVGSEIVLLCPFDWQRYLGKSITVTVVTEELVEASTKQPYMISP